MSLRRLATFALTTATLAGAALAAPAAAAAPNPTAKPATAQASAAPAPRTACPKSYARIACVDLTAQQMWIQQAGRVTFGPVPIRTGRAGFATPTGLWHVYLRNANHWSTLYDVAMPYSQFFTGGVAFHAISGSVFSPPGSHGCVNMRITDAQVLWTKLQVGDPVHVTGRKLGT